MVLALLEGQGRKERVQTKEAIQTSTEQQLETPSNNVRRKRRPVQRQPALSSRHGRLVAGLQKHDPSAATGWFRLGQPLGLHGRITRRVSATLRTVTRAAAYRNSSFTRTSISPLVPFLSERTGERQRNVGIRRCVLLCRTDCRNPRSGKGRLRMV
jgi:hypothetical protein